MKKKIIAIILIIVLIVAAISIFLLLNREETTTDAYRFSQEYTEVEEDNVFVYRSADEIINILENGTGTVFLGFPECQWCQRYAKYLNEVAKEEGIEKIYYYNIKEDRANNTSEYQKIIEIIGENLSYDEEGNLRIYVPDVTFVKRGEIIGHDNETSMESGDPDEYWTEEKISSLKEKLASYMREANPNICDDGCNE